jgi:hypothetical protein
MCYCRASQSSRELLLENAGLSMVIIYPEKGNRRGRIYFEELLSEVGLRSCRENSTVYHLIREIGFQEKAALVSPHQEIHRMQHAMMVWPTKISTPLN